MSDELAQVAQWLREAASAVAFTGAGISTESGIPDFRSPGGVWAKYQPVYYDDFMRSPESRYEYWRQKSESHADFAQAEPNVGHRVLARWEAIGRLQGVITQNIDGLHQVAGSQIVHELHGTAREIACQDCGARFPADEYVRQFLESDRVPSCPECRTGRMKHATISFGQALPAEVLNAAFALASAADVFLAMGSSLQVYPAAGLPEIAKQSGSRLIIINRDPTPQDHLADAVIQEPTGQTLARLDELLGGTGE